MGTTDSQVSRGLRTCALGKQFNIAVVANCYGLARHFYLQGYSLECQPQASLGEGGEMTHTRRSQKVTNTTLKTDDFHRLRGSILQQVENLKLIYFHFFWAVSVRTHYHTSYQCRVRIYFSRSDCTHCVLKLFRKNGTYAESRSVYRFLLIDFKKYITFTQVS